MWKVPTGGRKKKLKVKVAAIERIEASINPQVLATMSTSSKYKNPTVVALTRNTRAASVSAAMPASDRSVRTVCEFKIGSFSPDLFQHLILPPILGENA